MTYLFSFPIIGIQKILALFFSIKTLNQEWFVPMKKNLLIILIVIVLFVVGYFGMKEYKEKQLVNEAQDKAEEYLMENYEDVESVQIDPDNYHFDPMGGLSVGGYINNENHLTFYITFLIQDNKVGELRTVTKPSDFPDKIED